jgi:N-methylhydantoinase A/oxoprolinase/acetone carboxylase beta subunit
MALDVQAGRRAVAGLGRRLGLTVEQTAAAIHRVVNENMASAARMHAIERGRDLRRFALVATGGAGPVHAWGVARALGIERLVFPPSAGVASAFGMLTAAPGFELARSLPSPLRDARWTDVRRAIAVLVREGTKQLATTGIPRTQVRVSLGADVRYAGQGETVAVELGAQLGPEPAGQVQDAFDRAYTRLYGRRPPGVEAEVMTWRVRVTGPFPRIDVRLKATGPGPAHKGSRPAWFAEADGFVQAAVYDRYRLKAGDRIGGPAVVEERESTMVVGPGGRARVDEFGNLEVETS